MAVARYLLKTFDGIDRPAIAAVMPNRARRLHHGAGPGRQRRLHPEHLLQFAVMGSALVAAVDGKEEPSVGLLNIGEEAIKGSETIKRAGELLRAGGRQSGTSTSTATSKATTSSRAPPTSWSATASSATCC